MDGVIQIGFLTLAVDRLLAMIAITAFIILVPLFAERLHARKPHVIMATIVGILASRAAYVLLNLEAYSIEPWSALAFWQGGFTVWPGAIAAAVVVAWRSGNWLKASALAAVPLGIALILTGAHRGLAAPPVPLPSSLVVQTLDGKPMHLDAMRGEPFVLNLWATWCPPCQREMPMMADVAARSPIPVFFINQGEDAPKIRAFLNDRRLTEATVLVDTRGALGSALQAPALPTTLFVDATGQVRVRHSGEISRAALTATIRNLERNPP